jgi:hypothetical protein
MWNYDYLEIYLTTFSKSMFLRKARAGFNLHCPGRVFKKEKRVSLEGIWACCQAERLNQE